MNNNSNLQIKASMDVDSQPSMEETILVGDDLMMGPSSPIIPPEIASHVLENVELCDGILRNLFLYKYSLHNLPGEWTNPKNHYTTSLRKPNSADLLF
ncbi:transmembrane protein [Thalictrum thalictroides]|uniref:Transmembrane protein n=1 Tax=Thalictrum thalictroides TaxID=46969 RepID=A0A7J6X3C1_THATH|nr:transmembrane protein [Thalictrum thalictroides]